MSCLYLSRCQDQDVLIYFFCFDIPKGDQHNPFKVPPAFHFWAPWIDRNTCRSNSVLNTEFEKVHPAKPAEICEITVSEDRLTEKLYKQKVKIQLIIFAFLGVIYRPLFYLKTCRSSHILFYLTGSSG